jgi:hypothetical protein
VLAVVADRIEFPGIRLQALAKLRCVLEQILTEPEQPTQRPIVAGVRFWSKSTLAVRPASNR